MKFKQKMAENWPVYRSMLWRLFRGAVATAFAQTMFLTCGGLFEQGNFVECAAVAYKQWTNPEQAATVLVVSFASGVLMAFSVGLREWFGNEDRSKGIINKLIV